MSTHDVKLKTQESHPSTNVTAKLTTSDVFANPTSAGGSDQIFPVVLMDSVCSLLSAGVCSGEQNSDTTEPVLSATYPVRTQSDGGEVDGRDVKFRLGR